MWTDAASEPAPGAHLTTPRWGYVHHGIYAGNGRVIHYRGFNRPLRRGPVEDVSVQQFARGRRVEVKAWVAPAFTGPDAVARARSRLGEDGYRFWSNNCEHFAQWCISGVSRSQQVEALKARVGRVLGLLRRSGAALSFRLKPARRDPETSLTRRLNTMPALGTQQEARS